MKQEKRKKTIRIILIVLIVLILIISFNSIKRLAFLLLLAALNLGFAAAKRLIPKAIVKYIFGLELVMFSTVLISFSFGPIIGMASGALLMLLNYIGERRFSQYFIITTLLYSIIGYSSYFLNNQNVILIGILMSIGYNILSSVAVYFLGANMKTMLAFNIVNILFNVFLFTSFGNICLRLLS